MKDKTIYYCPVHTDQVLFENETNLLQVLIADKPTVCPQCAISYYKWECVEVEE